jgi:hypothetical protein
MREMYPSEKIGFSMIDLGRKGKIYRPSEFFHSLSSSVINSNLKKYEVRSHINNQIQKFTKLGIFQKVDFGQYRLMVSKKQWEAIAKESYGLIDQAEIPAEVQQPLEDQSAKIQKLEGQVAYLWAAFVSIAHKLEKTTDIHQVLVETGKKIEVKFV